MYAPKISKHPKGFTLAELLIAIAILGVIGTFTINKLMITQQVSANNAKAQEVAVMITTAFQEAQNDGIISASSKAASLTPYMNYIAYDTSGTVIDSTPLGTSSTCGAGTPCIWLHNGGVLWLSNFTFAGTSNLNTIDFRFDPDGRNNTTSIADGPLKAVQLELYYNGFITTRGKVKAGSVNSCCGFGPGAYDPSWFSW